MSMGSTHLKTLGILVIVAMLFTACSGSNAPAENVPTTTSATATPRVSVPTFSFTQPTVAPSVATAAAISDSGAAQAEAIARGRTRYEALECGSCHGANGEGSPDGSSLLDYNESEDDFVTFMRSGGALGTSHQYASNRLSQTGAANLYQYLLSLESP